MDTFVKDLLLKKGFKVNSDALEVINVCDDWYSNRPILDFHNRKTIQGVPYDLNRLNFAKRGCSDDANLCEVLEINAGSEEQFVEINDLLNDNQFQTQYRKQLEKVSATGTAACYIRLDGAALMDNGKATGGKIKINYVDAECFLPLSVENDIVTEAAFSGSRVKLGKKETTVVLFLLNETGNYTAETHVFDTYGTELMEQQTDIVLGNVKPFAIMRNAEVNNLDGMNGYGLSKIWNAIPALKAIDLAYNTLYGDLEKSEKIILLNELLVDFDDNGIPKFTPEQKKLFVLLGEKLPEEKDVIQEYNPEIRIDGITKSFELALSLLSMSFGYGTKKYSFENGQITTATEYIGERQDQMQELNRQRQEATEYIRNICQALMWFSNTFHGTSYNLDEEIMVEFDDSYVTDREAELDRVRNDALSFDIPQLTIWYLMQAYNLTEKEATELVKSTSKADEEPPLAEE